VSELTASAPPRLRTVLCTCGGLYGALVLRRLRASDRVEICGIIRSTRVLDPRFGFLRGALTQIRNSGVAYALYLWCATTLTDWLCAVAGMGAVPMRTATPGIPVLATRDINDAEGLCFLKTCMPDLLVSAFFNQRVGAEALEVPEFGCVNIHPSLLPDAKGVDPVFQCLLREVPALGVTVHIMSLDLDAGGILAQRPLESSAESSVFATTALLFCEGAELLVAAIESGGGGNGSPQRGAGNYQSWPTRQDVRNLWARGGALMRFADLVRLIRGKLPRASAGKLDRWREVSPPPFSKAGKQLKSVFLARP
jgi:methionyl-tRNA formyltransferase